MVATTETPPAATASFGSKPYRTYALASLLAMYTLCHIDRVLVPVLQEPIKHEFGLSDLQLGLMVGPAFALFYATLGLPVARLAERANRVALLGLCLTVWSGFTALFAFSVSYLHLLASRIGVGVGEAGAAPAAHSLISSYFPPERRATAMAVFALAGPLGTIVATFLGGWIAQEHGWRAAFLALGLPGLAIALLLKLTVREPPRPGRPQDIPTFGVALKTLWRKPSYRHLVLAAMGCIGLNQAQLGYIVSFMLRTHDISLTQATQVMGAATGICGAVAVFMLGVVADRLQKRHPTAIAWLPAISLALAAPVWALTISTQSVGLMIVGLMAAASLSVSFPTAIFTIAQNIAPVRMRATSSAVMMLLATMVGQSLGPPLVGALSDFFAELARGGVTLADCKASSAQAVDCAAATMNGLRTALLITSVAFLWPAFHFWRVSRTLLADSEGV